MTLNELMQHIVSFGYPIQRMSYSKWLTALKDQIFATTKGDNTNSNNNSSKVDGVDNGGVVHANALEPLLPYFDGPSFPASTSCLVDQSNTLEALEGSSVTCPLMSKNHVHLFLSALCRHGLIAKPPQPPNRDDDNN